MTTALISSDFSAEMQKWAGAELNRRHTDFQSVALPTELPTRKIDNLPAQEPYCK
jgi:hypothetical protein